MSVTAKWDLIYILLPAYTKLTLMEGKPKERRVKDARFILAGASKGYRGVSPSPFTPATFFFKRGLCLCFKVVGLRGKGGSGGGILLSGLWDLAGSPVVALHTKTGWKHKTYLCTFVWLPTSSHPEGVQKMHGMAYAYHPSTLFRLNL